MLTLRTYAKLACLEERRSAKTFLCRILTGKNATAKGKKIYVRGRTLGKYVKHIRKMELRSMTDLERNLLYCSPQSLVRLAEEISHEFAGLQLATGVRITFGSDVSSVYERSHKLARSCMTYKECIKYLELYDKSPNIGVAYIGDKHVVARCLLFKHKNGFTRSRVYTSFPFIRKEFLKELESKIVLLKTEPNSFDPGVDLKAIKKWPFADDYAFVNFSENLLYIGCDSNYSKADAILCETDGSLSRR